MNQAQQIIAEAKETGLRIEIYFEDRTTVRVGSKTWKRIRKEAFWNAISKENVDRSHTHYHREPTTDRRKGFTSTTGYLVLIK